MRLRIHHGAAEIGGNCVELQSGGLRLLLDLGLPLDREARLPQVNGLIQTDPELLGVVLSHPHLDHYGLLPLARPDLPVWLGEGAARLLAAAAPFTAGARLPQVVTAYRDREPFQVGPFAVTPYLMDHSAYDAYGLLVEAEGKRIFYSGDFRGHGRKAAAFDRFLAHPPSDIDLLLMEGTTLGRDEPPVSEEEVEHKAAEIMRATSGLVLVAFSAQNIDRFVSLFRASVRSGRTFVADAYLANLVTALQLPSLPDPAAHPAMRVYLPRSQKRVIVAQRRFDLIERYRRRRIYTEEIACAPARHVMMFRGSMAQDLASVDLGGGAVIYSLWPGYLERDRVDLRQWASRRDMAFHLVHSSGHAHTGDLKRTAQALKPGRITPIHTGHPHAYAGLFPNVEVAANGMCIHV